MLNYYDPVAAQRKALRKLKVAMTVHSNKDNNVKATTGVCEGYLYQAYKPCALGAMSSTY